jgi:hypothetical protein
MTLSRTAIVRGFLVRGFLIVASVASLVVPGLAQEGHPLEGTWYGDFGTTGVRHDLTVLLDWSDGQITGVVHPGPNQVAIDSAVLEITPGVPAPEGQQSTTGTPPRFHVRFEVDAPDGNGGTDSFVFEGEIFNPVAGNRRIAGTWSCGGESGSFQMRRL